MLPKIKHMTFDVKIFSLNKTVKCRPFTVEEEKLFLMAKEETDEKTIYDTILQVVDNCIVTPGINVNEISSFDIEYLIIKIRSKSVGEIVELKYVWEDEKIPIVIDLDEVEIKHTEGHKKKFMITDDLGIVMKYPNLSSASVINNDKNNDQLIKKICSCIDQIYDNDKVYDEYTEEELVEFITSLPLSSLKIIGNFFKTMPKIEHVVKVKNKEGNEKDVTLKGLRDFFII
jgi:hypothetical protein